MGLLLFFAVSEVEGGEVVGVGGVVNGWLLEVEIVGEGEVVVEELVVGVVVGVVVGGSVVVVVVDVVVGVVVGDEVVLARWRSLP